MIVDVHQVGTSCGFSMPFYDFVGFRPTLNDFFAKKAKSELAGNRQDGIDQYVSLVGKRSAHANVYNHVIATGHIRMPNLWMDFRVCKGVLRLPKTKKYLR